MHQNAGVKWEEVEVVGFVLDGTLHNKDVFCAILVHCKMLSSCYIPAEELVSSLRFIALEFE